MQRNPTTRRLAAIVIADVVGYTRLMERDEGGTHARLREVRDSVSDPTIAHYGGRIVKTAGDGMVVEFPSATAALRCAVDVQREMGHRNLYVAPDEKLEFRIGINLGDVLIDGDDIAGDGVNVAARLETLAEPGGICIGATVHEQVHGDLGFDFIDLGEQQVKNIERPIRAYRVTLAKGARAKRGIAKTLRAKRSTWLLGGAVAAVVVIAAVALWAEWPWQSDKARAAPSAQTAPAPPMSIAILPFTVSGGGPDDAALSETLTRDVTASVARVARYAWVVSYAMTSTYKGHTINTRAVGRELNVRYVAESEVRHTGDGLVINAALTDASTGTQVSSDRLTFATSEVTGGNDAMIARISKSLRIALIDAETRRAARRTDAGAGAVELWLRGNVAFDDGSLKGVRDAKKLYDEALRQDPDFVGALLGEISTDWFLLDLDANADQPRLIREMDDYSRRAVTADRNDPRAWLGRAGALVRQKRWAEASEALSEILRIDPGRSDVYKRRAEISVWTGLPEQALAQLDKARTLDPREADEAYFLRISCQANLSLGRLDDAVNACERSAALQSHWEAYLLLTAAYAQKGQASNAANAAARLLKFQPGLTIARYRSLRMTDFPAYVQQTETNVVAGLRKAGLPEQ